MAAVGPTVEPVASEVGKVGALEREVQAAPAVTGLTLRQILAGYKAELLHAEQLQQEGEQSHGHDHDHDHR